MANLKTIYVQDTEAANITAHVTTIYECLKKDVPRIIVKTDWTVFIPNGLS